ncbi:hypothetical protein ARMSODRAFT_982369 [Armillaria solidipes]|uniref:RNase H type-1 domain-containing protein n=1 Tax=Armillaria solidipes TaxID=1076256 RepID=A0A2H3BBC8_9AGAR|nr:hypothetical protein ARMSODRAFT_982369 [Armillaria solidipes]
MIPDLTTTEQMQNMGNKDLKDCMKFDPCCETSDDLTENFHIFAGKRAPKRDPNAAEQPTFIYIAGRNENEHTDEATAGGGAWFGTNDERNIAVRAPNTYQTSRAGEICAILAALKSQPYGKPGYTIFANQILNPEAPRP